MKLLDFGVGGVELYLQKGLFIANFKQTKFYPKRRSLMKEKKRKMIGIALIAIIILCVIGIIASPSDDKQDDKKQTQTEQTEKQNTEATEQDSENAEPETEEKDEVAEIEGVDIIFSETVRDDKTGNWRLAKVTGSKSAEEYAVDYYKQYFKADNEVHAVVNYTLNTTACITCVGDTLNVRIYEHIEDEEQYAENLFTGTKYAEYNVNKSTGDVEKVE